MNQRKMYRILLTERDSIFTDIALDAANSNGAKYVPIAQLEAVANGMCRKYPATGSSHTVKLSGNVLTIDKGEDNILIIEEVEIMDLMDELNPVLVRNGAGIADETNHELLN